jgi:hypothetical protein
MRFYDGHVGPEEVFIRSVRDYSCCAGFRSDFADRQLPWWLRNHRGPLCPQHFAQAQEDRAWINWGKSRDNDDEERRQAIPQ